MLARDFSVDFATYQSLRSQHSPVFSCLAPFCNLSLSQPATPTLHPLWALVILLCLSNLDFLFYLQETLQAATGTGSGLKGNRLMHLFCKFHTRATIIKYISINSLSITGILWPPPLISQLFFTQAIWRLHHLRVLAILGKLCWLELFKVAIKQWCAQEAIANTYDVTLYITQFVVNQVGLISVGMNNRWVVSKNNKQLLLHSSGGM